MVSSLMNFESCIQNGRKVSCDDCSQKTDYLDIFQDRVILTVQKCDFRMMQVTTAESLFGALFIKVSSGDPR